LTHNAETKIDLNVYKQRLKKIRHWRTIDNNEQLLKLNLKIKAALQSKTFNKLLLDKLSTKKKFIESLLEKGHHF
jgi:hypothetical protein